MTKMKVYDRVELINDRAEYAKRGVHKGDVGTVMMGERNGYVLVYFDGEEYINKYGYRLMSEIDVGVRIDDLSVIDETL